MADRGPQCLCGILCLYSWTLVIRTRLFQIPYYFKLETISLGFALQSFTISFFELPLFQTFFWFPRKFEIAGSNCIQSLVIHGQSARQSHYLTVLYYFQVPIFHKCGNEQISTLLWYETEGFIFQSQIQVSCPVNRNITVQF